MRRGALVLCGGRSRRMGRDKGSLPFGGETLLQRTVRLVAPVVDEVVVAAREGQELPDLPAAVKVTRDPIADRGPIVGLLSGLRAAAADAVFLTGCDTPFLRREVVDVLFDRLGDAWIAVADAGGRLQPLCAVYRREVVPHIERLVAADRLRPAFLFDRAPTVRVGEEDLRRVDPELETFRSCNTPEAYAAALERERGS